MIACRARAAGVASLNERVGAGAAHAVGRRAHVELPSSRLTWTPSRRMGLKNSQGRARRGSPPRSSPLRRLDAEKSAALSFVSFDVPERRSRRKLYSMSPPSSAPEGRCQRFAVEGARSSSRPRRGGWPRRSSPVGGVEEREPDSSRFRASIKVASEKVSNRRCFRPDSSPAVTGGLVARKWPRAGIIVPVGMTKR